MKTIKNLSFKILLLLTIIGSFNMKAQTNNASVETVDILASVDANPPLAIGDTFTYTLQAVAGTTPYTVVQIYLEYNEAVIQLNSLTPDYTDLNIPLANDTSVPEVIRYSAGTLSGPLTGTTTLFTAVFEVVGTSEFVMITHDLAVDGNSNGTGVAGTAGLDITGSVNDIILATLHTETNTFSNAISIYPNPAKDVVNIQLNAANPGIQSINMYTIDGKLVLQKENITSNSISIDTSKFHNAIYFMKVISTKNEVEIFKILVDH
ncbi:putative secreted protein (Por secretion system target) [Oceanihabitans sediminis]|uniref:T9SS C-terminal target domain-containing protein n=1 Tax=Oceanihabitans sediminis TaxID=1812012 RepID=A0A368P5R0_9FLAO|nr:T9SS type A sorting domain-containing protein [Oceanihabitans sediminis]RBP29788.1 putative secreted protein (Por secretion system target) [Oceanihabitans sediminis]RCU57129.1 T9SS C-terminal target domain-containing protein [Oceanihabitans sediminis]